MSTTIETFTVVGMSCQHCIDAVTADHHHQIGIAQLARQRLHRPGHSG